MATPLNLFWGNVPWEYTTPAARGRTSTTPPGKTSTPTNDGTGSSYRWFAYEVVSKPVWSTTATTTNPFFKPWSTLQSLRKETVPGFGIKINTDYGKYTFGQWRRINPPTVESTESKSVTSSGDQRPGGSNGTTSWTVTRTISDKPLMVSLAGFTSDLATPPSVAP